MTTVDEPLKFWKEPLALWSQNENYPGYRFHPQGQIMAYFNKCKNPIIRQMYAENGLPKVRLFCLEEKAVWVETGLLFLDIWSKPKPLGDHDADLHCGFYNGDRTDFDVKNLYYTTAENIEMAKLWSLPNDDAIFKIKEIDGPGFWAFRNVISCAKIFGMDPMDVVKLRTGRLTYKGYDWGYGLYD